jgi:hypothetical protein
MREIHASDGAVELALYVAQASLLSRQAERALRSVLQRFDPQYVRCSVVYVEEDPAAAERDGIIETPTLVRRAPLPRMWLIGNLQQADLVTDLLYASGVREVSR